MDFDDLKLAIESQYGGTAIRLQSVPVTEKCEGKTVWEGIVHIFSLTGNAKASIAYAWSSRIEGSDRRRYSTALHTGEVTGPQQAVQAVHLAEQNANDNNS